MLEWYHIASAVLVPVWIVASLHIYEKADLDPDRQLTFLGFVLSAPVSIPMAFSDYLPKVKLTKEITEEAEE